MPHAYLHLPELLRLISRKPLILSVIERIHVKNFLRTADGLDSNPAQPDTLYSEGFLPDALRHHIKSVSLQIDERPAGARRVAPIGGVHNAEYEYPREQAIQWLHQKIKGILKTDPSLALPALSEVLKILQTHPLFEDLSRYLHFLTVHQTDFGFPEKILREFYYFSQYEPDAEKAKTLLLGLHKALQDAAVAHPEKPYYWTDLDETTGKPVTFSCHKGLQERFADQIAVFQQSLNTVTAVASIHPHCKAYAQHIFNDLIDPNGQANALLKTMMVQVIVNTILYPNEEARAALSLPLEAVAWKLAPIQTVPPGGVQHDPVLTQRLKLCRTDGQPISLELAFDYLLDEEGQEKLLRALRNLWQAHGLLVNSLDEALGVRQITMEGLFHIVLAELDVDAGINPEKLLGDSTLLSTTLRHIADARKKLATLIITDWLAGARLNHEKRRALQPPGTLHLFEGVQENSKRLFSSIDDFFSGALSIHGDTVFLLLQIYQAELKKFPLLKKLNDFLFNAVHKHFGPHTVQFLLKLGANSSFLCYDRTHTALQLAIYRSPFNETVLFTLYQAVPAEERRYPDALIYHIVKHFESERLIDLLLQNGENPAITLEDETALHLAIQYRNFSLVRRLLRDRTYQKTLLMQRNRLQITAIHVAARVADEKIFDHIWEIAQGLSLASSEWEHLNNTPTMASLSVEAAKGGNLGIFQKIGTKSSLLLIPEGQSLLLVALLGKHIELTRFLLKAWAEEPPRAIRDLQLKAAREAAAKGEETSDALSQRWLYAPGFFQTLPNQLKKIDSLKPPARSTPKKNGLHLAIELQDLDILNRILAVTANLGLLAELLEQADEMQQTPLTTAFTTNNFEIIEALLRATWETVDHFPNWKTHYHALFNGQLCASAVLSTQAGWDWFQHFTKSNPDRVPLFFLGNTALLKQAVCFSLEHLQQEQTILHLLQFLLREIEQLGQLFTFLRVVNGRSEILQLLLSTTEPMLPREQAIIKSDMIRMLIEFCHHRLQYLDQLKWEEAIKYALDTALRSGILEQIDPLWNAILEDRLKVHCLIEARQLVPPATIITNPAVLKQLPILVWITQHAPQNENPALPSPVLPLAAHACKVLELALQLDRAQQGLDAPSPRYEVVSTMLREHPDFLWVLSSRHDCTEPLIDSLLHAIECARCLEEQVSSHSPFFTSNMSLLWLNKLKMVVLETETLSPDKKKELLRDMLIDKQFIIEFSDEHSRYDCQLLRTAISADSLDKIQFFVEVARSTDTLDALLYDSNYLMDAVKAAKRSQNVSIFTGILSIFRETTAKIYCSMLCHSQRASFDQGLDSALVIAIQTPPSVPLFDLLIDEARDMECQTSILHPKKDKAHQAILLYLQFYKSRCTYAEQKAAYSQLQLKVLKQNVAYLTDLTLRNDHDVLKDLYKFAQQAKCVIALFNSRSSAGNWPLLDALQLSSSKKIAPIALLESIRVWLTLFHREGETEKLLVEQTNATGQSTLQVFMQMLVPSFSLPVPVHAKEAPGKTELKDLFSKFLSTAEEANLLETVLRHTDHTGQSVLAYSLAFQDPFFQNELLKKIQLVAEHNPFFLNEILGALLRASKLANGFEKVDCLLGTHPEWPLVRLLREHAPRDWLEKFPRTATAALQKDLKDYVGTATLRSALWSITRTHIKAVQAILAHMEASKDGVRSVAAWVADLSGLYPQQVLDDGSLAAVIRYYLPATDPQRRPEAVSTLLLTNS